jgi:hypothetical protein
MRTLPFFGEGLFEPSLLPRRAALGEVDFFMAILFP